VKPNIIQATMGGTLTVFPLQ